MGHLPTRIWTVPLAAACLLGLHGVSPGQEPEILVEAKPTQIYEGESVRYRVLLNHFEESTEPDLSAHEASFHVRLTGKSMANTLMSQSINGVSKRVVRRGPMYEYELTPKETGSLRIPAPTAQEGGRTFRGQTLTLEVKVPDQQDVVALRLQAEPEEVYPTQWFSVRLTISVQGLPDTAADQDPLTVQALPDLRLPWAEDKALAEGLEPAVPWDRWLNQYVDARRRRGVAINRLEGRQDLITQFFGEDPFDPFSRRDSRLAFRPEPQRVMRRGAEYWEYTFERRFRSSRAGTFAFGPVSIKGTFATRMNTRGGLEGESIYAVAKGVSVRVRPPPEENRPETYIGAIGQFECGAHLAPTKAKVGDPLTLTLWLRGDGSLEEAVPPRLEAEPAITGDFKLYEATSDLDEGMRRFTYSLRPKHDQVARFPAVPISYFDVDRGAYVTLTTDPIPLEIAPAEALRDSEIAMAAPPPSGDVETQAGGIFANIEEVEQLRDQTVRPDRWFLGLGGMALLYLVAAVVTQQWQRVRMNPAWQRRRTAAARARERLSAAVERVPTDPRSAAERFAAALLGLVSDAAGDATTGMTSQEAAAQLAEWECDPELRDRFGALLEACDQARFGATLDRVSQIGDDAYELTGTLVTSLRKKKLLP